MFVFLFCILYTLLSQWEFLPWKIWVAFARGKPAATESRYPTLGNCKVHAGCFCASIIHRTLTWTTGSLMCIHYICDHSYACVYTLITSQHNVFDLEKLPHIFLVLLTPAGFEPRVFGFRAQYCTHWATPSGGRWFWSIMGLEFCLLTSLRSLPPWTSTTPETST